MDLENIGLDCPTYDVGDCSMTTFEIGEFYPIGANNGKLVIKQNDVVIGEFFADQSDDTEVNIDLSAYATTADVEADIETAKGEMQELIDAKASIAELEEEANLREEEDTRLAGEINQLGTELNAEVNARTQADTTLTNAVNTKATISALTAETTNRENADNELQSQIDAITSQSDVVDIVGTYAELQAYDTSHLGNNDIVKVLTDSTHDNAPSYFRWNKTAGTWNYVGSESVAYTKAEADDRFVPKTRTINGKALSANVTLTTNDLTNDSGYLTESDLTDYVKNTDYATSNIGGVIRGNTAYALAISGSGYPYAQAKTYEQYGSLSGSAFIGKTTLENVLNGRKYLMPEYTLDLPTTGEANKLYLTPATEQPDIEATASGKDIELADASEGDLIDWTIKGDTEQNGEPSPSPDYPQEVKTVTGRNTVSVVGKNLFNITDEHIKGSINGNTGVITEYSDFTLEISEGKIKIDTPTSALGSYRGYISKKMYLDNGTYSLSFNRGENVGQYVAVFAYDKSDTFMSRLATLDTATKTMASFTKADNVAYVRIAFETTAKDTVINFSNIQLEKGSSKTSYQPYSGQEVEINLGKNLFDNAKVANAMTGSVSGGVTVTPITTGFTLSIGTGVSPNLSASAEKLDDNLYTKIEPNTTYTFSFDTNFTSSGSFLIGYSYDASTNKHIKVIADTNQTKVTFNIPYDNIVFRFASGTDKARTFSNIQLERGDKATEYAPYFEPIELCKLGDYQDRIYKDGDTWKIEKHVGKSTFNGSENWFKSGASTADIFVGALNIYDLGFRLPYVALYRQNIASNLGKQTSDTVVGGIDIYNQTSGFFAYIRTSGTTTYASDIATFKEKLAENNMQFYYLLVEPQVTEITYQPLIDQLNELETLATVKGYNHITTDTPSVQPFLEFGYFRPDPTDTKDEWLWVENHYEQIGGGLKAEVNARTRADIKLQSQIDAITGSGLVTSAEATKLKVLTQTEYDALTPASDTIYFIKEA